MALLLNAGDTVSRSYSYTQPSPLHPIQPQECGERTGNLCDEDNLNQGYYNNTPPFAFNGDNRYRCFSLNLTAGTYSILVYGSNTPMRLLRVSSNSLGIGTVSTDNEPYTFDLTVSETVYISFRNTDTSTDFSGLSVMMNSGETVLPHEPYGQYKIPILSANTTTPVYLGEVESTRRIKKYKFTGEENIQNTAESLSEQGTFAFAYNFTKLNMTDILDYNKLISSIPYPQFVSTHFKLKNEGRDSWRKIKNAECGANASGNNIFLVLASNQYTTSSDFKSYLATQYANGTPVTVWYVLATPTTGIVNEPIRKIGDYADTVSGITIPTITGKDTFDVQTTLKPSEVSLSYTGWHDATVKEWDGSEWD